MKKLLITTAIISALSLSGCGFEVVDAGETGVKKTLGVVEKEPLGPGWYTYNPFTTSIVTLSNLVERREDKTSVYTKDVQQAQISYVATYNLLPQSTVAIYTEVGYYWDNQLVPQVITASIKNAIGKWNAIELIANRQKATDEIEAVATAALASRGIVINNIELTDVSFADQFEQAVEAKVVAVQRAEEAKNTTVRVQEEANQRIIAAKADAEAMGIKTTALKEGQSLVLYEAVQKWNGVLPQIITGEGGTMLQLPVNR